MKPVPTLTADPRVSRALCARIAARGYPPAPGAIHRDLAAAAAAGRGAVGRIAPPRRPRSALLGFAADLLIAAAMFAFLYLALR